MRNQTAVGEKQADVVLTNLFNERPKPADRAPLQPSWPQTSLTLDAVSWQLLFQRDTYYFYCDLVNLFWFLLYGDTLCYLSFLHHVLLDLIKNDTYFNIYQIFYFLFKLHIITLTFPFFCISVFTGISKLLGLKKKHIWSFLCLYLKFLLLGSIFNGGLICTRWCSEYF